MYLRDAGETEIGGFGISRRDALLAVEDFVLLPQTTTPVTVAFDDEAIADYFEDQVLQGRNPEEFGRIWIHTHPGRCPAPSGVDEETFARVFGACDWAVMLIVARGGATYARLSWHVGPGGALEIPVRVDYGRPFAGSDAFAWQAEYDRCVRPQDIWTPDWDLSCPAAPVVELSPFRTRSVSVPFLQGVSSDVDGSLCSPS